LTEHISRKELKQDKIRESFEHGAEAVISHKRFATIVLSVIAGAVIIAGGWRIYSERRSVNASGAFEEASKIYNARIRAASEPAETGEVTYTDENTKLQAALVKFNEAADRYPRTYHGKLARYYGALCLEGMGRYNQALEQLQKVNSGGDKELAALTQFQTAQVYAHMGKTDEAVKIYRALADQSSVLVPRATVLLELAAQLRAKNPKEAADLYAQIKKEFPDSAVAEEADRGLEELPKT
jgi:predicted negative regulator of RcsB-dependent stress response